MPESRVVVSDSAGVAEVKLNRPSKRNGLDRAMFEGIVEAGEALMARNDVRAIVLHGEGACFCAGLDFMSFMGDPTAMQLLIERGEHSAANMAQRVAWIWREVPQPVIAAVHGVAFGGGLQIAAGADIRYAAPDTKLSIMELKYGLIPDMGITATLLPSVRDDALRELVYTARIFDAAEAQALGIVTALHDDPLDAARQTAAAIASRSPHAVRAAKQMLNRATDLGAAEALALETELQLPLLQSPNQLEAVMASFQKRAPTFTDPE